MTDRIMPESTSSFKVWFRKIKTGLSLLLKMTTTQKLYQTRQVKTFDAPPPQYNGLAGERVHVGT